jgi:hypothetical protein
MIRFRPGGWDRGRGTFGQGAADRGEYRQAARAIAEAVAMLALNTDSVFGIQYKRVVRVAAGIACSVDRSCRAPARCPCTVEML